MTFKFQDMIVLLLLEKISRLLRDSAQKLQPCTDNVSRLSQGCNKVVTISARVKLELEFALQTLRCS